MRFIVEVTQHGLGLTYGKITYDVNAEDEEEAKYKAIQKAKKDFIVAHSTKILSHSH